MAVHSNCPKCQKQVLVPEGAGDAIVRCPLCNEEYELSQAHALFAPALIVVRPSLTDPLATGPSGTVHLLDVAPSPEFQQDTGSGAVLLQEREHVVPITIPHDEAEELHFSEFKVSEEPDTSFHLESGDGGEHPKPEVYAGQTVYFDAPPHPGGGTEGDMVAFDPEQRFDATQVFEPVELEPFGDAAVRHDDNPFAAELFGEHAHSESTHEQNGDVSFQDMSHDTEAHGDHGIEMLHEPAAGEDDAAPWNPSNWGEPSEHESAEEHGHHEHSHHDGDEIGVVEDDAMSAVDFAGISSTDEEPGATPAKKKKRRASSGGGLGRILGVVVSGLAAIPAVGLLGAVIGPKTDVFGFRPYLQKVPYVSKYVGAPALTPTPPAAKPAVAAKPTAKTPVGEVNAAQPTGPILNGPQLPETPIKPSAAVNPNQVAANPGSSQPNKPFNSADENKPVVAATKETETPKEVVKPAEAVKPDQSATAKAKEPKSKEPDNLVADAGTAKKPAKEGDDAGDPFSTPAIPAGKPEAKPEDVDPLAGPPKPDASAAAPEIKPIGPAATAPVAGKEAMPNENPAVPEVKGPEVKAPEVKSPEVKTDLKPVSPPDVKPADKSADSGDPFSTPDAKPEAKSEKTPEPTPKVPVPETPTKPEINKPEINKPEMKPEPTKPAAEVPVKPELKPDVPSEIKPELKPEVRPEVKPEIKPEIKPVAPEAPAVGPKTALTIEAAALGQAMAKTTPPAEMNPAAYNDLCKLAEMATYVKAGGETDKKSLSALLAKLATDPQAAGKLTALAKSRLDDSSATGGVVLAGSVIVSKVKGDLCGTALKIEGQAAPVMIFSAHSLDLNANDKVVVPGAIVRDPLKNLPGYTGKQPVIVWTDSAVKLP